VVQQALETEALILGTDKERGKPEVLLHSIPQFFKFLPGEQKHAFLEQLNESAS
jgi:hypothetical protein